MSFFGELFLRYVLSVWSLYLCVNITWIVFFMGTLVNNDSTSSSVSDPHFCWGGQLSVPNFEKGDQKKMSAWRVFTSPCHYYVSCQKQLCKMKYGFEGSIFKCQSWPVLAKQPVNV